MVFAVFHALGDSILMRTAECGKHQGAAVRLAFVDVHTGDALIHFADSRQIRKIKLRINALRVHIECQCDNIDIACAFAVAEERALDAVCAGKKSQFAVSDGTAAVVMRMERNNEVFAVFQMLAHIFDLVGVHVRHGMGNRDRQVDDDLAVGHAQLLAVHGYLGRLVAVGDLRRDGVQQTFLRHDGDTPFSFT